MVAFLIKISHFVNLFILHPLHLFRLLQIKFVELFFYFQFLSIYLFNQALQRLNFLPKLLLPQLLLFFQLYINVDMERLQHIGIFRIEVSLVRLVLNDFLLFLRLHVIVCAH